MERVEREIGFGRLRAAAAVADDALPPIDQQQLDLLVGSHGRLRPAALELLAVLELRAAPADNGLVEAITLITAGHRGTHLMDAGVEVLPKVWRSWVTDDDGRVRRVRYELAVWFCVRDALRAGRLFRPASRRYADPASFLMPAARWESDRAELAITFGRTTDAHQRLAQLEAEQHAALERLQAAVDAGEGVALRDGRLTIAPIVAEPPPATRLATEIAARLPQVELTDVLAEVECAGLGTEGRTPLRTPTTYQPARSKLPEILRLVRRKRCKNALGCLSILCDAAVLADPSSGHEHLRRQRLRRAPPPR
jgi:hypothetical protein